MAVKVLINGPATGQEEIIFNLNEMYRQCVECTNKKVDPEITLNNFFAWVNKLNRNGMFSRSIPITDGASVVFPEGQAGSTALFSTNGTFDNLVRVCPQLADYDITLELTAHLRVREKQAIVDLDPQPPIPSP